MCLTGRWTMGAACVVLPQRVHREQVLLTGIRVQGACASRLASFLALSIPLLSSPHLSRETQLGKLSRSPKTQMGKFASYADLLDLHTSAHIPTPTCRRPLPSSYLSPYPCTPSSGCSIQYSPSALDPAYPAAQAGSRSSYVTSIAYCNSTPMPHLTAPRTPLALPTPQVASVMRRPCL